MFKHLAYQEIPVTKCSIRDSEQHLHVKLSLARNLKKLSTTTFSENHAKHQQLRFPYFYRAGNYRQIPLLTMCMHQLLMQGIMVCETAGPDKNSAEQNNISGAYLSVIYAKWPVEDVLKLQCYFYLLYFKAGRRLTATTQKLANELAGTQL